MEHCFIISSPVSTKIAGNCVHSYPFTAVYGIVEAIVSTHETILGLKYLLVVLDSSLHASQKICKVSVVVGWSVSKGIKEFHRSISGNIDDYPMFARFVMWVCIHNQQTRVLTQLIWQSV